MPYLYAAEDGTRKIVQEKVIHQVLDPRNYDQSTQRGGDVTEINIHDLSAYLHMDKHREGSITQLLAPGGRQQQLHAGPGAAAQLHVERPPRRESQLA